MNKVIAIGRLTKDPEVRSTQDGTAVAKYSMALDRAVKKEGQPSADFINCVAWGKNAEFAEKFLAKGMKIAIEGRIQTGHYTDKNGNTVYTTDIVIDRHEFCEKKGDAAPAPASTSTGEFMDIPDGIVEELPFN